MYIEKAIILRCSCQLKREHVFKALDGIWPPSASVVKSLPCPEMWTHLVCFQESYWKYSTGYSYSKGWPPIRAVTRSNKLPLLSSLIILSVPLALSIYLSKIPLSLHSASPDSCLYLFLHQTNADCFHVSCLKWLEWTVLMLSAVGMGIIFLIFIFLF